MLPEMTREALLSDVADGLGLVLDHGWGMLKPDDPDLKPLAEFRDRHLKDDVRPFDRVGERACEAVASMSAEQLPAAYDELRNSWPPGYWRDEINRSMTERLRELGTDRTIVPVWKDWMVARRAAREKS